MDFFHQKEIIRKRSFIWIGAWFFLSEKNLFKQEQPTQSLLGNQVTISSKKLSMLIKVANETQQRMLSFFCVVTLCGLDGKMYLSQSQYY